MPEAERAGLHEEDLPVLDVMGEDFQRNPLAVLADLRSSTPYARSRRGVEVLRYSDVARLVTDERLDSQDASSYEGMGAPSSLVTFAKDGLLVAMRGEKHRRIRRLFSAVFRVTNVERQRKWMAEIAATLLADLPDECDLVSDFTKPYPMRVLCRLIGVPAYDIPLFSEAATELHLLAAVPLVPGFPRVDRALTELRKYVGDLVEKRRAHPEDDVVTSLIALEETEGRLTNDELAYNLVNLIFAGQDTTRYQLASAIKAIAEAPDIWTRLSGHPEETPAAVEETLRLYPVTRFIVRIPRSDVSLGGVEVRAGRRIILNMLSASRDPDRFAQADRFVLRPQGQRFEIPFGWGMHHCLGAALARTEIQEALRAVTSRFTGMETSGAIDETAPAGMLYGPESMPVRFHRALTS